MSLKSIQRKLNLKQDNKLGPITAKAIGDYYKLNIIETAQFLGQCDHETGGWHFFKENLNYSAQGLANTWPNRFAVNPRSKPSVPNQLAKTIQRNQELIANHTYANRMGNGDIESGDGFKFIGRGAIQLTGKNNYIEFAKYVNDMSILDNPDKILTDYILESAKWFFDTNNLWRLCKDISDNTITLITRRINGGTKGLEDRINKTNIYYNLLTK